MTLTYNYTKFPSPDGVPIADFTPVDGINTFKHQHDGMECVALQTDTLVKEVSWQSKTYTLADMGAPKGAAIVGAEIAVFAGNGPLWAGQIWEFFRIWLNDGLVFDQKVVDWSTGDQWVFYEDETALALVSPLDIRSTDQVKFGPWQHLSNICPLGCVSWVHGAKVRLILVKKFTMTVTAVDQHGDGLDASVEFIDPNTNEIVDIGSTSNGTLQKILASATYKVRVSYGGAHKTQTINLEAEGQSVSFSFLVGTSYPVQFVVRDVETNDFIAQAAITIYQAGQEIASGLTELNGSFTFNLVGDGVSYTYAIAKTDYTTKTGSFTVSAALTIPVLLEKGGPPPPPPVDWTMLLLIAAGVTGVGVLVWWLRRRGRKRREAPLP